MQICVNKPNEWQWSGVEAISKSGPTVTEPGTEHPNLSNCYYIHDLLTTTKLFKFIKFKSYTYMKKSDTQIKFEEYITIMSRSSR